MVRARLWLVVMVGFLVMRGGAVRVLSKVRVGQEVFLDARALHYLQGDASSGFRGFHRGSVLETAFALYADHTLPRVDLPVIQVIILGTAIWTLSHRRAVCAAVAAHGHRSPLFIKVRIIAAFAYPVFASVRGLVRHGSFADGIDPVRCAAEIVSKFSTDSLGLTIRCAGMIISPMRILSDRLCTVSGRVVLRRPGDARRRWRSRVRRQLSRLGLSRTARRVSKKKVLSSGPFPRGEIGRRVRLLRLLVEWCNEVGYAYDMRIECEHCQFLVSSAYRCGCGRIICLNCQYGCSPDVRHALPFALRDWFPRDPLRWTVVADPTPPGPRCYLPNVVRHCQSLRSQVRAFQSWFWLSSACLLLVLDGFPLLSVCNIHATPRT